MYPTVTEVVSGVTRVVLRCTREIPPLKIMIQWNRWRWHKTKRKIQAGSLFTVPVWGELVRKPKAVWSCWAGTVPSCPEKFLRDPGLPWSMQWTTASSCVYWLPRFFCKVDSVMAVSQGNKAIPGRWAGAPRHWARARCRSYTCLFCFEDSHTTWMQSCNIFIRTNLVIFCIIVVTINCDTKVYGNCGRLSYFIQPFKFFCTKHLIQPSFVTNEYI